MVRIRHVNHNNSIIFIMKVKIDTREKFHVITFEEHEMTANMTESLKNLVLGFLENEPKNIILNFKEVSEIEESLLEELSDLYQLFSDQSASFVICELPEQVRKMDWVENINFAPTESEAWDIVQMEEIERELFNDDSSY